MTDAKTPFASEQDYIQALTCHHAVMQCAMKAKQNVDPAVADQLAHAVGDFSKMYLPVVGCASASQVVLIAALLRNQPPPQNQLHSPSGQSCNAR